MKVVIEVPGAAAASLLAGAVFCSACCFPEDGDELQRRDRAWLLAVHEQIEKQIREEAGGE